jgi:hypothetical protein
MKLYQKNEVLLTKSRCLPHMPHISADSDIQEVALRGPAGSMSPDIRFNLLTGSMAITSTTPKKLPQNWHVKTAVFPSKAGSPTANIISPAPWGEYRAEL